MGTPASLDDFKTDIKYRLGYPVVNIELSTEQFDLAVNEAITFYQRNHMDGSERVYLPIQVTSDIKTNKYVTMPADIISVTRLFKIAGTSASMLSTDFVLAADAMWAAMNSNGMVDYYMLMSYRSLIEDLVTVETPIRFTMNKNRVYVDAADAKLTEGLFLLFEGYRALDPENDIAMLADPWLNDYTTAKVKQIWGTTLKKYQSVAMPGGIMLDGQTMYTEATETIEKMESEVILKHQLPIEFYSY